MVRSAVEVQGYRLSAQQRRLHGANPDGRMLRSRCVVEIVGEVAAEQVRHSLRQVVARHDILRTVYQKVSGIRFPLQVIAEPAELAWQVLDWRKLSPARQQGRLEELLDSAEAAYDGPCLSARLARLTPSRGLLVLHLPALSADEKSFDNLVEELARDRGRSRIEGAVSGEEGEDEAFQYVQFSEWQGEMLAEDRSGEEFWRPWRQRGLRSLPLPWDHSPSGEMSEAPAAAPASGRPQCHRQVFDGAMTARIAGLARELGVDEEVFYLGCLVTLLYRLSECREIPLWLLLNGRPYDELAAGLGPFAQHLPMGVAVEDARPFADLLDRIHRLRRGMEEREVHFEWSEEDWDENERSALAAGFLFDRQPRPETVQGVSWRILERHVERQPFQVHLACFLHSAGADLRFHSDLRGLASGTIPRFSEQYASLARALLTRPRAEIADVDLLADSERRELLVDFQAGGSLESTVGNVVEALEATARHHPDAIAVEFADQRLGYGELAARADRLARHLVRRGVGPEEITALYLERSAEMVVVVWAVLKAGGAYLPLDPTYPPARLEHMIEDAGVRFLVTREEVPAVFAELEDLEVILLPAAAEDDPEQGRPARISPENLAYVLYTSGSTGRPKGVMVPHAGLTRYLSWCAEAYAGQGAVPLLSPLGFDLTVTSFFAPLIAGRRVVLLPERKELESLSFDEPYGFMKLTPSHLEMLSRLFESSRPETAPRALILGGEALRGESLAFWRDVSPHIEVVNEYGPTEAVVGCIAHTASIREIGPGPVPIGRPIAAARICLVNRFLRPVPSRVAGEILVGARSLARGYLGRPGLTAQRFVPDAIFAESGARLYRTGDLARHRGDGTLDFLGRMDHQVKLRGYRIELGEIEAVLAEHPEVREVVVAVREDPPFEARLVAYFTERAAAPVTAGELERHLRRRLPEYMVPAAVVKLDAIPLDAHGKVDRARLPAPEPAEPGDEANRPPRTEVEKLLAEMWRELLRRPAIGLCDHFFDHGGHSLLGAQLIARIRQLFSVDVTLHDLFETPVLADLARLVELRGREAVLPDPIPPLAKAAREGDIPLSFAQQRLWFLDQFQPGSSAYNIANSVRLSGALDSGALRRAFDEIVRRHEILRTTFAERGGRPVQVIAALARASLPGIDLSSLEEPLRGELCLRLLEREAGRPFDLAAGPLLRSVLFRLGPEEHVLALTQHHIISDGWSQQILVREMVRLYQAFSEGSPVDLDELPVQYADYAIWQRRWLRGEMLETQLAYWRRQLAEPTVLELPVDRPRPPVQTFPGRVLGRILPRRLFEEIEAIAAGHRVTAFMTLLAACQVLLHHHTGQEDVLVGTPVANRDRPEVEGLIGFFVNTLVLRGDLAGDPQVARLLEQVRETVLEGLAHQEIPFEQLVEVLETDRSMNRTPLFQVMFVFEAAEETQTPEFGDLRLSDVALESTTAKFDLLLYMREGIDGLQVLFEYNTDLFEPSTILRLSDHFENLLEGLARDPERRLTELPVSGRAERHQLLAEWNDTASARAPGRFIEELFEARAAAGREAVAVLGPATALSYGELDREANRLAHLLCSLGVGPGDRVGLCLDRTPRMIVALLAILKSGAAYVPLERSFPAARIQWILASLSIPVLLTESSWAGHLEGIFGELGELTHLVVLNAAQGVGFAGFAGRLRGAGDVLSQPVNKPPIEEPGDRLAYVIFTSGSTGTPKGVAVRHRPVLGLIHWVNRTFGVGAADRVLFVTSPSFDLSVYDVFGLLAAGGSVRIASQEEVGDPERLVEILVREPITYWDSAPAALQQLEAFFPSAAGGSSPGGGSAVLRLVFLSGDWIPLSLPGRVRDAFPNARVVGLGGATEATVWSNYHPVTRIAPHWMSVPYGRPIDNARYHVTGERLVPRPIGVAGDLFIGGDCLAAGYAGEPALTSWKFIADPFSRFPSRAGARLYRTGDRARYMAHGELQFLGRVDHQVKIRGFRIELGEIEATVKKHRAVAEAVALVRESPAGDRQLVAFLRPRDGASPALEELRQACRRDLPEYMVPFAFVVVDEWPLTANGKLDRKKLLAIDPRTVTGEADEPERELAVPRTPVEELLSSIWTEVLGVERIGRHDDFFALGGHSLLATQAISRMRDAFGVEVSLRHLFEAPRIDDLAHRVEQELRGVQAPAVPEIRPVGRDRALPLSYAQERLWFLDQLHPGSPAYNIPAAVRIRGALEVARLAAALSEVARRHEALRTRFELVDEEPFQVIDPPRRVALPVVDLARLPAGRRDVLVAGLVRAEAQRPFDLRLGPLLRVGALRLAPGEHVVLLTLHHIVSDGWSMELLIREVSTLLSAPAGATPGPLPELPVQFADYAVWQRGWLSGATLEAEVDFWRRHLDGAPPLLELPTDRPRPPVATSRGATFDFELPPSLHRRLREASRATGSTLFMTLLAGFQALLGRWAGQDDVSVGTPIAGRNRLETESLIGFFVNTLVLRARISEKAGFRELLASVRDAALDAHAHQEVPFEKLVEELDPQRSFSHSPLFQAMFILQNIPQRAARFSGLELEQLDGETGIAKFDLTLAMAERGERLDATLEYNTDLFDRTSIRRLARHFETLLAAMSADLDRPLARMELLSRHERHQLLREWDAVGQPFEEPPIHELFAARAAADSAAPAVRFEGRTLTYGDLEARANQLAHGLLELGLGRGRRAAVMLESGPLQPIALLAVLKAGGAFVALDPDHPAGRLDDVIEQTRPYVLLTDAASHAAHRGRVAGWRGHGLDYILVLDAAAEPAARVLGESFSDGRPTHPPAVEVVPGDPLFIVFTSGSTGRPKGIVQSHRSFAQFLAWQSRFFAIGPGARFAAWASITYDASYCEILGALGFGATLCMAEKATRFDPRIVLEWVGRERISILQTVPSFCRHLLTALAEAGTSGSPNGSEHPLGSLDWLLLAGEALSVKLARECRDKLAPHTRLCNLYGPTEAVLATREPIGTLSDEGHGVALGRAIDGRQILVLDSHGRPCPLGVVGEICLRSPYLSSGYLDRPAETGRAYLACALPELAGASMYRTGDLGRLLGDGRLEFRGRVDHQLKIRGMRVEPGEIEAHLAAHEEIDEAAVVGLGEEDGAVRLVAYLARAAEEGRAPTDEQRAAADSALGPRLRRDLAERLPAHMIPADFVVLPALPKTRTGKLDRRNLPKPRRERSAGEAYQAPRGATEERIAAVWRGILGLDRVGRHDEFFALGGHSLLAVRLLNRMRQQGIELSLGRFFEDPSIAGVARRARQQERQDPIPRVPRAVGRRHPVSPAQERLWFLHQLDPGDPAYNMFAALRLRGPLRLAVLERSFEEVVRRHETLRTRFGTDENGAAFQVVEPPSSRRLIERIDLEALPARKRELQVRALAAAEQARPFDLGRGPVLRIHLLRLARDEHVLLLALHHIVADGWSMEVLVREMGALYTAFSAGRRSPLPELPIGFIDWVCWRRPRLGEDRLTAQLRYWKRQLSGAPDLRLAEERSRGPASKPRGRRAQRALEAELEQRLRALAEDEGTTLFLVLLAAFQLFLGRYCNQDDIVTGIDVVERDRGETEGLIALMANQLPLRTRLSGDPSFRKLLTRVRRSALEAYANQDVPFQDLVVALRPDRAAGRNPIFQVMFALTEASGEPTAIPGLEIDGLSDAESAVRFDLRLVMRADRDRLYADLEYDSGLFDDSTAERMLRRWVTLLSSIVERPDAAVSALEMISAKERSQHRAKARGRLARIKSKPISPRGET